MDGKRGFPLNPSTSKILLLHKVVRAYRNWESTRLLMNSMIMSFSAVVLKMIWERVMDANGSLACVGDIEIVVFAFVFRLRESSVKGNRVDEVHVPTSRKCEIFV